MWFPGFWCILEWPAGEGQYLNLLRFTAFWFLTYWGSDSSCRQVSESSCLELFIHSCHLFNLFNMLKVFGPMCCLIMSEQVSLSTSLITLMKQTAQWEFYKFWRLPVISWSKQIKRSFCAAEVVYMLIMQPHCSLCRMYLVCLSQFW